MPLSSLAKRIGDTPLSIALRRYLSTDGELALLWRLQVRWYCTGPVLMEIDATPEHLQELADVIERAQQAVATDGGRNPAATLEE